ncbi:exostosin 1b [Trichuris trichiura]|uniref:Exostosin 1b n=1 Tax=Trichuris trichiura TaxID=36087 RepID=A0A077Z0L8_TRITR|nr:exostosin 1b [Trichuris trichiura]
MLWYSQLSKDSESADEANVAITWPAPIKRVQYKNAYLRNFTFKDTTSRPRVAQRLLKPCSMDTCFDYSRCRKRPLRVYIYPRTNMSGDAEPSSESYEKILQAIRDSKFYTKNPKEACIFILPWDTLSRDNLSPFYVSNMRAKIKSVPEGMWNNGVNHLIFNLYSGTWPNYDLADLGFDPGKAILAKASFSTRQYRRNYDVSLALFHQILPLRGPRPVADNDPSLEPSWVSAPSHYLLVFKGKRYVFGIGSETRNALYHLHNNRDVIMLTTCKHGKDWKRNQDERCAIDNTMYDRWTYEELMQNSSFCLVPRGRRLGSFRFLEALEKGCIPVILSNDWVLPFSEVIDWSLATVRADERTLFQPSRKFQIPSTLRSINPSIIDRMRLQARHLYRLYFASVDKIVDTVLQIIQDRIWSWEKRTRLIWNSGIAGSRYHSVDFSDRLRDFPFYFKPAESARLTAIILCSRPWNGKVPSLVEDLGKSKFIDKNMSLLEVARNASTPLVTLDYAVELWRWVPHRLIGFDAVEVKYSTKEKRWSLSERNDSDPYTLLTGNAILFHRYYSWVALDPPLRSTRKLVQKNPDCWDTVLNYIVAEITGSAAVLVQAGKAASRSMSLSSGPQKSSLLRRQYCFDQLLENSGYLPLRRSSVRHPVTLS